MEVATNDQANNIKADHTNRHGICNVKFVCVCLHEGGGEGCRDVCIEIVYKAISGLAPHSPCR